MTDMKSALKRTIAAAVGTTAVAWMMSIAVVGGQAAPPDRPPMTEEVFKNIQVLKGIPVDQFMATMGFFSSSTGLNCTDCHSYESGGSWDKYADDTPLKRTARRMITMMQAINEANFGGRQMVTCNTCHRGTQNPNVMPSLTQLYGTPPPEEPGDPIVQAQGQPTADSILDKYIAAVGGAQKAATFTSYTGTGTYRGYDDSEATPLEIFVNANGQRATIVHALSGLTMTTYDGRTGWMASPATDKPFPLIAITGQELDGVKLEAQVFFPSQIKQALRNLRVGFPTEIDDRQVRVVQGTTAAGAVATLCFDAETGLLVRLVRYNASPVGRLVTRVDYSDYRDVAGIKMPFKWTVSWLDGRSVYELARVQPNVAIEPAKFAKPVVK
jgi:photosynthetic reaction center cytochrome c subunit